MTLEEHLWCVAAAVGPCPDDWECGDGSPVDLAGHLSALADGLAAQRRGVTVRGIASSIATSYGLNSTQLDVLELVLEGRSNAEIGATLGLERGGVKWTLHNVLTKTGETNREGLLRLALLHRVTSGTVPLTKPDRERLLARYGRKKGAQP